MAVIDNIVSGYTRRCLLTSMLLSAVIRPARGAASSIRLIEAIDAPETRPMYLDMRAEVSRFISGLGLSAIRQERPWSRAIKEARSGEPALVYPIARTPGNEAQWKWVHQLLAEDVLLWVRRDALPDVDDAVSLRRLKIGVIRDSMHADQLHRERFDLTEIAPSENANVRKLAHGRIAGWVSLRSIGDRYLRAEAVDPKIIHPPLWIGVARLYLAAPPQFSQERLDNWLAKLYVR